MSSFFYYALLVLRVSSLRARRDPFVSKWKIHKAPASFYPFNYCILGVIETQRIMRKPCFLILLFCLAGNIYAQSSDEKAVLKILDEQTKHWNQGDLEKFVQGYWNHDSLMFIGKNGVTYGFQNMLNNYKRNYSDSAKMGKLAFEIINVQKLSNEYYFVVGKWSLQRSIGDLSGHYTLLFRKINNEWVIVADHSS